MKDKSEKERIKLLSKVQNHIDSCEICKKYMIDCENLSKHLKEKNTGYIGWCLDELNKSGYLTKYKLGSRWKYSVRI